MRGWLSGRTHRDRGYGAGARYATSHGLLPDYVVLGEPTGMNLMIGHFGSYWVKLTSRGGTVVHTAWSRGVPNKIEGFTPVIDAVREWKKEFEEKTKFKGYWQKHKYINILQSTEEKWNRNISMILTGKNLFLMALEVIIT